MEWMQRCIALAKKGAGYVSPNPMVGAVVVASDGEMLGEGFHERFGRPHAEVNAIARAEMDFGATALCDATLYVNLEPCAHEGKTPPCADLIIQKEIPRVVVGMADPFPAVAGSGIDRLRKNGIEVTTGVQESACRRLNEAYLHHLKTARPLVTLKTAQTLDGRIATATGDSRWITGTEARRFVHQMRAEMDGVLVGSMTARTDDPALTVRHIDGPQPQRFVLDREGTLPLHLKLFTDKNTRRTCAVVGSNARPRYEKPLSEGGGRMIRIPERKGHLDLVEMLHLLGRSVETDRGPIQSLLVEAGPSLATALLREDLVDRLFCFVAPKIIGNGISTFGDLEITAIGSALNFVAHTWEPIGPDMLFRGFRRSV